MNFTGVCYVKPTLYIPSDETESDELYKICEVCQLSNRRIEKCPHKMDPISVPQKCGQR